MKKVFYPIYTNKSLVITIIVISVVVIIYNLITPSHKEFICNQLQSVKSQDVHGIVKDRYVDKSNHNYEIVEYSPINSTNLKKLNLSLDISNLFDVIETGDTVSKEKGSLLVTINSDTTIQIDYGVQCESE